VAESVKDVIPWGYCLPSPPPQMTPLFGVVQTRRKGMSPTMSKKWRDVTEGVGQTSRMAALMRSPGVRKRENITTSSTSQSLTTMSSDEEADRSTRSDVGQYLTGSRR